MNHQLSLIATNDPNLGATHISSDGSEFTVSLDEPMRIPHDAYDLKLTAPSSTVWWVIANIETGVNDLMKVISDGSGGTPAAIATYNLVIPEGLYDLTGLNNSIQTQLLNAGAEADGILELSPDEATQKVELILTNYTGISVDFTIANSFRLILGFDSQVTTPNTSLNFTILAENTANFNTIEYFLIHSDLVDNGMRLNGDFSKIIAQVLIDRSPGSQLISTPNNPPKIPCNKLIDASTKRIKFWLTDNQNNALNTRGEFWSVRVEITWTTPLKQDKHLPNFK